MGMQLKKSALFLIHAIFIFGILYARGITTNVILRDLSAWEIDVAGPETQLMDISEGFMRSNPKRLYPIFYSLGTSVFMFLAFRQGPICYHLTI